jgi:hypothetical protein
MVLDRFQEKSSLSIKIKKKCRKKHKCIIEVNYIDISQYCLLKTV